MRHRSILTPLLFSRSASFHVRQFEQWVFGLASLAAHSLFRDGMKLRILTPLCCVVFFAACDSSRKPTEKKPSRAPVPQPATAAVEESGDVAFQSFISRLRLAASTKDLPTLASMMPSDFGHRWDEAPQGELPFDYWDQHKLWGELVTVLNSKWTPHDGFMVAPPEMVQDPAYPGFRAGVSMKDGSWKFAYFVPPPPVE
jgi:hypothetical protein